MWEWIYLHFSGFPFIFSVIPFQFLVFKVSVPRYIPGYLRPTLVKMSLHFIRKTTARDKDYRDSSRLV